MGADESVDPPLPETRPQSSSSDSEEESLEPSNQENSEEDSDDSNPSGEDDRTDDHSADGEERPGSGQSGPDDDGEEGERDSGSQEEDAPEIEEDSAELKICLAELKTMGATFDEIPPVNGDRGCGITDPISVTEIIPGVKLVPESKFRCKTALALARWTRDFVVPATSVLGEEVRLTDIQHASTYICRRRNNRPDGKLSQHSFGNAIDIGSFSFDGRDPIFIEDRADTGTVEEAFQRAVRGSACLNYTTVIGPGTDRSHADHLHFDVIERNGGYRICQ